MSEFDSQVLFQSGTLGYHTYRIPALVCTGGGQLLAFAEARRYSPSDTGEIAVVVRASPDQGRTWQAQRVVVSETGMTCGNPAPVFDAATGVLWLLFCKNSQDGPERLIFEGQAERTVWATSSADGGVTWAPPQEITQAVKPEGWTWYATGPGRGIQLASGRLIVPCDHTRAVNQDHSDPVRSHVIYSDDSGASWNLGGIIEEACSSECGLIEVKPNHVLLEFRYDTQRHARGFALSEDGGLSFGAAEFVLEPPDPGCRGGVASLGNTPHTAERIFVSHVASAEQRENLVLRISSDQGQTWQVQATLWPGPAAYSELADLDGALCCLFEAGVAHPYESLRFVRLDVT